MIEKEKKKIMSILAQKWLCKVFSSLLYHVFLKLNLQIKMIIAKDKVVIQTADPSKFVFTL